MKLRTRILIAFFTMIILPILLTFLSLLGICSYQAKSITQNYGIESGDYQMLINSMHILTKGTKSVHASLQKTAVESPEKFENAEYLKEINSVLAQKYAYLIVRKDDTVVFRGTEEDTAKLEAVLPEYGDDESSLDNGVYLGGEIQSLLKQVDFVYPDGSAGSLFIISSVDEMIPQIRFIFVDMIIAILIILIFTSAFLMMWIYRGVNEPLRKLKDATQRIKEGDLDFTLKVNAEDEIGELCRDFEDMRKRLKESAEEKVQYDKENKELISNISHDLKTPITAVKGYVEGIMDGVADTPEKVDRYIKTIYNKANEMDRLINELTFYSKIDTNRIPYTFHKINVADYFADCAEEVGLELESKNIELGYFNYTDKDTVIIADAEQLKRVVSNIIGNSVKYIGNKKGVINIRIRDVGDFIQIEIEDNGKGIAQSDIPYIFDRFYRTDASRNSAQGGSGIGLSIVKKIVEDHGGKIWANSKVDTGTVMCFVIRKYQEVSTNE